MPSARTVRSWLATVTVLVIAVPSVAQQVTYHGSIQIATGDYFFTERTRSVYLSNGLTAELGRFTLSATVPIVLQDSPWISYSVVGTIPTGGTDQEAVGRRHGGGPGSGQTSGASMKQATELMSSSGRTTDAVAPVDTVSYSQLGVGDPGLRLDIDVLRPSDGRIALKFGASCKPPIADVDRGFGTGSWDAGIGLGTATRVGRVFVFVNAEYWWFGDMPELPLNDAWSYNLALGLSIVPTRLSMLVSYSGFTTIIDGVEPPRQVGLGLSFSATNRYSVSVSTSAGVTESASDFSAGIGWSLKI